MRILQRLALKTHLRSSFLITWPAITIALLCNGHSFSCLQKTAQIKAQSRDGSGLILRLDAICGLSLLLVVFSAPRGFSPGTPVFLSPQKPKFPNSNAIQISVDEQPLVEVPLQIPIIIIIIIINFISPEFCLKTSPSVFCDLLSQFRYVRIVSV